MGPFSFDANPEMVAGALRVDPSKFRSKGAKSVQSRIGNIRDFLPEAMSLGDFWSYLKTALAGEGMTEGRLLPAELEEVRRLRDEKYATWEWNFGRSPRYTLTGRRRWEGGLLEPDLSVENGRITRADFYGDFLSLRPLDELSRALCGCAFRREDVEAVLRRFEPREYFGGIIR